MRLVLLALLFSLNAFAGDKIGNGGALWACISADKTLQSTELVDLYEAQKEFGLTIFATLETDPFKIVQNRAGLVNRLSLKQSRNLLNTLNEVLANLKYIDGELNIVNDADYRVIPSAASCLGPWQYTQFANYTFFGTILIRQDLWQSDKVSATDKAALIWHEAIYRWLRLQQGDLDSIRARQAVGILFSNLPETEMSQRLNALLDLQHPPTPPGTFHGN